MSKSKAIYSELAVAGSEPRQLHFGTDSKAGRQRMGKLHSGTKGWLPERPHWGLWAWEAVAA